MGAISSLGGITDKETQMRRKVFDMLASVGGVVVVIVLVVAGALLMVGYNFANDYVHTQLAEQQITFPSAAAFAHPDGKEITKSMIPSVSQYAGQQLVTGSRRRSTPTTSSTCTSVRSVAGRPTPS